jgi:hypothetical protein
MSDKPKFHSKMIKDGRWTVAVSTGYGSESRVGSQADQEISSPRLYTMRELTDMRRKVLRFARSLPPGPERNNRRQIAASLRSLFRNANWLDAHTVEAAARSCY